MNQSEPRIIEPRLFSVLRDEIESGAVRIGLAGPAEQKPECES